MISDRMERLALKGLASWKVYNIATFDTATIIKPDNGFLLLRQIIYNHFCDADGTDTTVGAVLAHTIHCLSLCEKGSKEELYYNLRSTVIPIDNGGGTLSSLLNGNPNTIIDTFKIFTKDVCVDISRIQDMKDFTQSDGKMTENTEERDIPLGFGVGAPGINVAGFVQFPAPDSGKYFPNGNSRPIAGLAVGGTHYRDQFRNPTEALTRLHTAPANTSQGRQMMPPFISLGFWKVTGSPESIANA